MHVCCVHVKTCWSLLPSAFGRICCWSAQDLMPWMKTLWGKPSAQLMVLQGSPAYSMAWRESFVEVAYCWLWKVVTMSPCLVVSKTVQPFFLSISIFFLCGMMTCNNWFVQVAWNSPGMLCHLAWVLLQRLSSMVMTLRTSAATPRNLCRRHWRRSGKHVWRIVAFHCNCWTAVLGRETWFLIIVSARNKNVGIGDFRATCLQIRIIVKKISEKIWCITEELDKI